MGDWLDGLPLVDHHCHTIVGESRKADALGALRATSEAPGEYPLVDLVERPAWQAVLRVMERFAASPFRLTTGDVSVVGVTTLNWAEKTLSGVDYHRYCTDLFRAGGYAQLYVDGGYEPEGSVALSNLARLSGASTRPILRLERLCEDQHTPGRSFDDWWERVRQRVRTAREEGYVAAKSIAAYRTGLHVQPVSLAEARAAYTRWGEPVSLQQVAPRLKDKALIDFLLWHTAPLLANQALPLQFHTGYGDPDTDLLQGNPLWLRGFLETFIPQGLAVVLLHTYPYHREAGYLASVYEGVYFDVSLIIPMGLSGARRVLAEALELTSYRRFLFASDAHTRPEMFLLAADTFRDALAHHFADVVLTHYVSPAVRERWAGFILHANARKLYLGEEE